MAKKWKLPKPEKENWLAVHRVDNGVWYKRLEPEAYLICAALQKGLPLQAACERAFRRKKADPAFGDHAAKRGSRNGRPF